MTGLDEKILQCLIVDGRLPFRRVAEVVGVSEQTVARRYRGMRDAGHVRVGVVLSSFARDRRAWAVRIRCRPDAAGTLAEALAARDDVGWVSLVSGGSEIDCATATPSDADEAGVLSRLPHTREVLSFDARALLHAFAGSSGGWSALGGPLDPEEEVRLRELADAERADRAARAVATSYDVRLTDDDGPLLEALAWDGRASVAALARELDRPVSRVSARLELLLGSGLAYVATDVLPEAFGFHASAVLHLRVPPGQVVATGETLAGHRETGFVAATTGATNLMAVVTCRRAEDLFDYTTEKVGALPDVQHLDVAPVLRRVKEARARVVGGRFAPPRSAQA